MCKTYLKYFEDNFDELYDKFIDNPQRELQVTAYDDSIVRLRFDASRIKAVMAFRPLQFEGHVSLPVVVENKTKHYLAYDRDKEKWFLPCGRAHFPWCASLRRRKP